MIPQQFNLHKHKYFISACEDGNLDRVINLIKYGEDSGHFIDIHYNDDEAYKTLCHYRDTLRENHLVNNEGVAEESEKYEEIISWLVAYSKKIYSPINHT